MEKQGRKAQELWLACQTLHNLIRDGKDGAKDLGEAQLKPLSDELEAIKSAGGDHEFVSTVVETFPEEAIKNGVWTREALMDRFQKVRIKIFFFRFTALFICSLETCIKVHI